MKKCELCTSAATTYCESDSASLCWDCDTKVHSANFLVERHSRSVLCNVCRSPTAWSASGPKLPKTVSVCEGCVGRTAEKEIDDIDCHSDNDDIDDIDDDHDVSEDDEGFDSDDDVEEEDEQVVPLTWPPPPASSSSNGDESSIGKGAFYSKRLCDGGVDFSSDDDFGYSSCYEDFISFSARDNRTSICVNSFNRFKRLRTLSNSVQTVQCGPTSSETFSDVDSHKIFHQHDVTSAENIEAVISETRDMDQNTLAVGSASADLS